MSRRIATGAGQVPFCFVDLPKRESGIPLRAPAPLTQGLRWRMATLLLLLACLPAVAVDSVGHGVASWYGEAHRGKLMANGKRFDPDKFTAASWFYPLGTTVRVTMHAPGHPRRSVLVTITDRGPARDLVREGRIIDLGRAPFKHLAHPDSGLVVVSVQPVRP